MANDGEEHQGKVEEHSRRDSWLHHNRSPLIPLPLRTRRRLETEDSVGPVTGRVKAACPNHSIQSGSGTEDQSVSTACGNRRSPSELPPVRHDSWTKLVWEQLPNSKAASWSSISCPSEVENERAKRAPISRPNVKALGERERVEYDQRGPVQPFSARLSRSEAEPGHNGVEDGHTLELDVRDGHEPGVSSPLVPHDVEGREDPGQQLRLVTEIDEILDMYFQQGDHGSTQMPKNEHGREGEGELERDRPGCCRTQHGDSITQPRSHSHSHSRCAAEKKPSVSFGAASDPSVRGTLGVEGPKLHPRLHDPDHYHDHDHDPDIPPSSRASVHRDATATTTTTGSSETQTRCGANANNLSRALSASLSVSIATQLPFIVPVTVLDANGQSWI
ncbi:hypothetical protein A1O3_02343 [Capronia epimyces CBS 606.96]|uniref:Uncharacterized protein n=1 Tax=Capronia epimyces CBS 606.96 TaxID=1182542 RepID=W9Y8V2_9EURO|nr:uncharacterized protein A1O3_02343 [Capronia epimyces CBS 606.96]EXJ89277.1 hypothetical protein A1O3_02343 [Capronia epimyces CBS 606.96]